MAGIDDREHHPRCGAGFVILERCDLVDVNVGAFDGLVRPVHRSIDARLHGSNSGQSHSQQSDPSCWGQAQESWFRHNGFAVLMLSDGERQHFEDHGYQMRKRSKACRPLRKALAHQADVDRVVAMLGG
jgi:hypothetical protein